MVVEDTVNGAASAGSVAAGTETNSPKSVINDTETLASGNTDAAEKAPPTVYPPMPKDALQEYEEEQKKISSMISESASKGMIYSALAKYAFRHTKHYRNTKRHNQICRKSIETQVCQSDCNDLYKQIILAAWDEGDYTKTTKTIFRDRRGSSVEAAEKKGKSK